MKYKYIIDLLYRYSKRDQTVRFAYATCLRVEGKQTQILRKTKTLRI
jgi:hypothetical protein